jgi:hypothetical protein
VEGRQHGDNLIRRSTNNGVTCSKAKMIRAHGESAINPIRTKEGVIAILFEPEKVSGTVVWDSNHSQPVNLR